MYTFTPLFWDRAFWMKICCKTTDFCLSLYPPPLKLPWFAFVNENEATFMCDFESWYLKNQWVHESKWWFILLDLSFELNYYWTRNSPLNKALLNQPIAHHRKLFWIKLSTRNEEYSKHFDDDGMNVWVLSQCCTGVWWVNINI